MHDTYTKLMLHQDLSQNVDAVFYEKLEKGTQKKRISVWKVAVVAACICLIIPGCVWAAETIFGVTKVTQTERPTYHDNKPGTGLDIVYENLEDYHIEDFSKHLQELKEYEEVIHESWAAAEEYLGIDLVDNVHFTAIDTYSKPAFMDKAHQRTSVNPEKHSQTLKRFGENTQSTCWAYNDQLFAARVVSEYERNHMIFMVRAMVSVDLPPEIKDDVYNYYHGYSITYADRNQEKVDIETEQYVTPSGIPVLIVTVTSDGILTDNIKSNDWQYLNDCIAFFSVNNVTYSVNASLNSSYTEEEVVSILKEFLDGFVIE